jgi:hypothetical protein
VALRTNLGGDLQVHHDVGDLFMALIHTCELNHVGAFDYLTELQRHAAELRTDPAAWMPWNYRANQAKAAPG